MKYKQRFEYATQDNLQPEDLAGHVKAFGEQGFRIIYVRDLPASYDREQRVFYIVAEREVDRSIERF